MNYEKEDKRMFITKKELNRRIETAIAQEIERREQARWQNEHLCELEKRIYEHDEKLHALTDYNRNIMERVRSICRKLDMGVQE
jgi:predicted small metal-binding protein